jgi:hypothetical protein
MSQEPWLVLQRAADAVHATAEAATPGPWKWDGEAGAVSTMDTDPVVSSLDAPWGPCNSEDGEWIALMSPAMAPHLETLLRKVAAAWAEENDRWHHAYREQLWMGYRADPAYKLALALLKEEQT